MNYSGIGSSKHAPCKQTKTSSNLAVCVEKNLDLLGMIGMKRLWVWSGMVSAYLFYIHLLGWLKIQCFVS